MGIIVRNIHTGELFEVIAESESKTESGETPGFCRLRALADGYEMRSSEDDLWTHFEEHDLKGPLDDDEIADSIMNRSMWWGRRYYRP